MVKAKLIELHMKEGKIKTGAKVDCCNLQQQRSGPQGCSNQFQLFSFMKIAKARRPYVQLQQENLKASQSEIFLITAF
jgi:hypothetical protein